MAEYHHWWEKPLRIIQPNLQVRDTERINPAKLAEEMEQLGANAIVFNVGGIYAWYNTKVPYHNQNPFLPENFDLLKEVIDQCHRRNLKFIARFDFSKATDAVYAHQPSWFVRDAAGEPQIIGAKRPGEWSLLMSTCINSEYRRDAVAVPVLDEVMTRYAIDGIFYNNPGFIPCWCATCRRKYRSLYQQELPADPAEFESSWQSVCVRDNIVHLYSFIKSREPELPMILYYNAYNENIMARREITDMFCTEPQDILSLGWQSKPEDWKPSVSLKVGRFLADKPHPFGIIHSSPGMDWRHTGLPTAEYLAWLSEVPANGGHIWHSITGIPDTIGDKRILATIAQFNAMVKRVEEPMAGAVPRTPAVLLWNGGAAAEGWAEGLLNQQVQYGILLPEQATLANLGRFQTVIVPEGWPYCAEFVEDLLQYVQQGGKVLIEGGIPAEYGALSELLGIAPETCAGEKLVASYLRFEGRPEQNPLQKGMEETELIAHRGRVCYCTPREDAKVLATLVPPFAPLEAVGAPPERASLPVSHTAIPLCLWHCYGQGEALFIPFSLSGLISEFRLEEHYRLMANAVNLLLGEANFLKVTFYPGLHVTTFTQDGNLLIHLVNMSGRRPLQQNIPLHDIALEITLDAGSTVQKVRRLIAGDELKFEAEQNRVKVVVPRLDVWECLAVATR